MHPPTTNRTVVIVDREAPREGEHRAVHGESSVILLHPPPPLAGASIVMGRERRQNDTVSSSNGSIGQTTGENPTYYNTRFNETYNQPFWATTAPSTIQVIKTRLPD